MKSPAPLQVKYFHAAATADTSAPTDDPIYFFDLGGAVKNYADYHHFVTLHTRAYINKFSYLIFAINCTPVAGTWYCRLYQNNTEINDYNRNDEGYLSFQVGRYFNENNPYIMQSDRFYVYLKGNVEMNSIGFYGSEAYFEDAFVPE